MIIYKTTNNINGKIYIGQDKNNNPHYFGSGKKLKSAIKKYGKENFIKEILEECDSKEILNEREIYWIDFYNSRDAFVGYNISLGGDGGDTISKHPEKEKIMAKKRENISNLSDEEKMKRSEFFSKRAEYIWLELRNNPNKLKSRNKKISDKQKGVSKSKEHVEKQRISLIEGGKVSGENNPMYGKKHTDESKKKISDKKKGVKLNIKPRSTFRFFHNDEFIYEALGQKEAKDFCKRENISFQVLCKKSDTWKNWFCDRKRKL